MPPPPSASQLHAATIEPVAPLQQSLRITPTSISATSARSVRGRDQDHRRHPTPPTSCLAGCEPTSHSRPRAAPYWINPFGISSCGSRTHQTRIHDHLDLHRRRLPVATRCHSPCHLQQVQGPPSWMKSHWPLNRASNRGQNSMCRVCAVRDRDKVAPCHHPNEGTGPTQVAWSIE